MTVQEFYLAIESDYQEILERLVTEERIKKFLRKMPETGDMAALKEAWTKNDGQQIFAYSHRLKGIAQNLSFIRMSELASELTEAYRNGPAQDVEAAKAAYEALCDEYDIITTFISQIE